MIISHVLDRPQVSSVSKTFTKRKIDNDQDLAEPSLIDHFGMKDVHSKIEMFGSPDLHAIDLSSRRPSMNK